MRHGEIVRTGIEGLRGRSVGVFVRLNGVDTGLTGEDIEAIVTEGLDAVAVPKLGNGPRRSSRLTLGWSCLSARPACLSARSRIMALPETARGIMDAYKLATACPRVGNIIGGVGARSGDVTRAIGYKWTRQGLETLYMASHILLAARAAGIEYPIGGGSLEVGDIELVRAQILARTGSRLSRLPVDPSVCRVPIANEIFAPSQEEIEWNKGVMQAMADAEKAGKAGRHVRRHDDRLRPRPQRPGTAPAGGIVRN